MTNNRVFLPGLVGSTQSPGESLEEEDIKSKDSGVITFGENGKYIYETSIYNYFTKVIKYQFLPGFFIVHCNTNTEHLLPSMKNEMTTTMATKKISPVFDDFIQKYWCQMIKDLENQLKVLIEKDG